MVLILRSSTGQLLNFERIKVKDFPGCYREARVAKTVTEKLTEESAERGCAGDSVSSERLNFSLVLIFIVAPKPNLAYWFGLGIQ